MKPKRRPFRGAGDLSSAAEDNIFGYTGGVFESELQIYSFRNRWYDPELGRFVQRDPAGYVDGLNLYLYGLGNPLSFTDPLGLFGLFKRWWHNTCEGVKGLVGGSGLKPWIENREALDASQQAKSAQLVAEGKMSQEQADALHAGVQDAYDAVDTAETDLTQARLDAVAAAAAAIPVVGPGIAATLEVSNAAVDVSQGQYGEAAPQRARDFRGSGTL